MAENARLFQDDSQKLKQGLAAMDRRAFLQLSVLGTAARARAADKPRPNILWITCEDTGQQLGCYGDAYATTPNLDRLAGRGLRYRNAWSNAPVCAPARTAIISGLYPTSTGAEHMRSMTRLPEGMKLFPCYLREAGYYASNNSKEDYNLEHTGTVWDDSSKKAHWRNRKPGQPFFSVFNLEITHESQIRTRPHTQVHNPQGVRVPAYHPDTPEARQDWAQYYDNITTMDQQAAGILKQLEEDGLYEETIVFFYGDHGSGMPRSKRFPYDSGLRVPIIVHIPEKYRHLAPPDYRAGGVSGRMVAFVDLGPTVLSLAGIKPPEHMQGSAFMGENLAPARTHNFGFRGRMDERCDLIRSVTDGRYVYIRNYMPYRIYGQYLDYMFQTPTTRIWRQLYDQGKLSQAQKHFWEAKPSEELYDLQQDRDEVANLAGSKTHQQILKQLRQTNRDHLKKIRDIGFLPEAEIHDRSRDSSPFQTGHNDRTYPMEKILSMAELASSGSKELSPELEKALIDPDSAVRYWAALGILMRGKEAVAQLSVALNQVLTDSSPYARSIAADALARFGSDDEVKKSLSVLENLVSADRNGAYVSLWALQIIDDLGGKADPIIPRIKELPTTDAKAAKRVQEYPQRIMDKIRAGIK
jgi:arylsulfatase A-like enzyme